MERRALGTTGYQVSSVGIGTWGLGGEMWRDVATTDAKAALRHALDAGINLVDTALIYSQGDSERLIGQVMGEVGPSADLVVASKIPPLDDRWPPGPHLLAAFPPGHLVASVEQSLRNLSCEALHIEQLHVWRDDWLDDPAWPEVRATMESLTRAGKVLHWGISVNDHAPDTALAAMAEPLIETVQVIYNLFDRSPERALFAAAETHQVGVLARVPFDEGALSGNIGPASVFGPDDFRSQYFAGDRKTEVAARVARLAELLGEEAETLPELALRFCLSHPAVSSVIPGMRRIAHVDANVRSGDGRRLSAELLTRLAEHAWDKNWYDWS